jgi:hypothetical protein
MYLYANSDFDQNFRYNHQITSIRASPQRNPRFKIDKEPRLLVQPAVQPCSLATPAALLLYNMISGDANKCFPIHMCTTKMLRIC